MEGAVGQNKLSGTKGNDVRYWHFPCLMMLRETTSSSENLSSDRGSKDRRRVGAWGAFILRIKCQLTDGKLLFKPAVTIAVKVVCKSRILLRQSACSYKHFFQTIPNSFRAILQ